MGWRWKPLDQGRPAGGRPELCDPFDGLAADDDVFLPEFAHEILAQLRPPRTVELFCHDLDDHNFIALCCALVFPAAFSRRAREAGDPAKTFCQELRSLS